jgi:Fe-S cluster assembly protein SufD
MDGNSKGVFNGKIFVMPYAQKTNAFQSNRNILLSDTATINTKPQLEIWADDVKCSHGCTSGQLDEEALFYLRSRGISLEEAKAMLLYAFALDTLAPIKDPVLKTYLDSLISKRLNKLA